MRAPVRGEVAPEIRPQVAAGVRPQQSVRWWLGVVVVAGSVGLTFELVLLEHAGDWQQVVPFALLALLFGCGAALVRGSEGRTVRILRVLAVVAAMASLWGALLHFRANYDFSRGLHEEWSMARAVWEGGLKGKRPVLAPFTIALLGVLAALATMLPEQVDVDLTTAE